MATDHIRYDLMVQDALRGVVKRVLTDVAREGLPGEHHLYVSFKTTHPGVRLSSRLKEKHPDEMTIVLQHQFWDLKVTDSSFEVGLSFATIPERLLVPFDSIVGFFDPSVQFGLKFDTEPDAAAEQIAPEPVPALKPVPVTDDAADKAPAKPVRARKKHDEAAPSAIVEAPVAAAADGGEAAKVVSLDAFRKKT